MPERKSGPVKPPVIEATAKSGADAETRGPDKPAENPAAAKPAAAGPPRRGLPPLAFAIGYVVGGALLGTALTGGLLAGGLLPVPHGPADSLAQRLDRQQAAIAELDSRVTAVGGDLAKKAESAELEALSRQMAAAPASAGSDMGAIQADLAALTERVDGLAGNAPSGDVAGLMQRLDALQAALDQQRQRSAAALAALRDDVSNASRSEAAQLPLLLVSLADAFDTGAPFAAALAGIQALQPDLDVPEALKAKADTGLTPKAQIQQDFEAALPAMLAAAPAAPDAGWQGAAMDWLKGQLALRPAEDPGGDSAGALVARLEAAVERRDYAEAADVFAALPAPMRAAAGDVPQAVAAHAEADAFIATLTRAASAPAKGAAR